MVLIFPEGSRTPDGALKPFKRGTLLLIKRSGATVSPVAVEGAFDVWPSTRRFPRLRGRLLTKVAPPIAAADLPKEPDAALDMVRRRIEETRLELRAMLRADTGGRFPAPGPGDTPYWEAEAK